MEKSCDPKSRDMVHWHLVIYFEPFFFLPETLVTSARLPLEAAQRGVLNSEQVSCSTQGKAHAQSILAY